MREDALRIKYSVTSGKDLGAMCPVSSPFLLLIAGMKTVTCLRFELTAMMRDFSWIARPHADKPTFSWKNLLELALQNKQTGGF